ncbi:Rqc2 family fibronectin-binding protein [Desulfurobacterium sp.]
MDTLYIEKVAEEFNTHFKKKKIVGYDLTNNHFKISIEGKIFTFVLTNPNGILIEKGRIENRTLLKRYRNLFIREVKTLNCDRIIVFKLVKITVSGRMENYQLIAELTGKNSNIFFTEENGKILFRAKEALTSARETEIGKIYQPPPLNKKAFKEITFGKVTPEGVEKNLYKYVAGLSPLNCKEIAFYMREGMPLEKAYQTFMEKHKNSKTAFIYFKNGKPKILTTFQYSCLSGIEFKIFEEDLSFIKAWDYFTRENRKSDKIGKIKRELSKIIDRKLKVAENRLKQIEKPEKLLKEAEEFQKKGELLKYNLHLLKPGTESVQVRDFTTEEDITIKIDPAKTPSENLNAIFKKAKRLRSRAEHEKIAEEELKREIAWLKALKEKVKELENYEGLQEIKDSLILEKRNKKKKKTKPFREIILPSGKTILIGKNRIENEILSLKVANPWDLWFHTKEIPGSHVILRLERNETPDDEDIETAASAAVFYSRGRESGKIKVDFTKAENLKKPPGTPPGFVIYRNEKTILTTAEKFEKLLRNNLIRFQNA